MFSDWILAFKSLLYNRKKINVIITYLESIENPKTRNMDNIQNVKEAEHGTNEAPGFRGWTRVLAVISKPQTCNFVGHFVPLA